MKIAILAGLLTLSVGAYALQEPPAQAQLSEQHTWLQQLVGDWTSSSDAGPGPDNQPIKVEISEHVRSLGGLWILAESSGAMQGSTMTSIMTLGYDPRQQAFIGSWVDTMQPHMWSYKGTLDDAKKTLTLDTEGPSFSDPSKNAPYRDVITLVSKDKKTLTSSVQGADGKWTQFMSVEYTRKAAGAAK